MSDRTMQFAISLIQYEDGTFIAECPAIRAA